MTIGSYGSTGDSVQVVEGCRLVGYDVLENDQLGVIKSDLGTYATPEHAEAMRLLLDQPAFFLIAATLTAEQFDRLAAEIRNRRRDAILEGAATARCAGEASPAQPLLE